MPPPALPIPPYEAALSHRVIGCAFTVHTHLGSGFHESVYQQALAIEMWENGLAYEREADIPLQYRGHEIGHYRADFVVGRCLVVELKALIALEKLHAAQLLNYLKVSGKRAGLLLNFGGPRVEIVRKLWTPKGIEKRQNANDSKGTA